MALCGFLSLSMVPAAAIAATTGGQEVVTSESSVVAETGSAQEIAKETTGEAVEKQDESKVEASTTVAEEPDGLASEEGEDLESAVFSGVTTITGLAHVQNVGWGTSTSAEAGSVLTIGSTGRGLRMESVKLSVASDYSGSIVYSSHVQDIGWQSAVKDGALSGTQGKALRVEAITISLTGELADRYDVYYRGHVQDIGWMNWAKNGEQAGSSGYSRRVEAMQIVLVDKGSNPPSVSKNVNYAFVSKTDGPNCSVSSSIGYNAHVSNVGWQNWVSGGTVAGTTGKARQVEGLHIQSNVEGVGLSYRTHVSNIGWMSAVSDGALSGTTGRGLAVEALEVSLTGENAGDYDVYYRAHVANIGWLGWAKNGAPAGSSGFSYAVEAFEIVLVKKGVDPIPSGADSGAKAYTRATGDGDINYHAHVSDIGWQRYSSDGATAGTTGKSKRVEALQINTSIEGLSVAYRAHVSNIGWQKWVKDGGVAGTTGRNLAVQAIEVKLEGANASEYKVYYRAHVSNIGWLDWASDGASAGTTGYGLPVEAFQIVIVKATDDAPGSTNIPFLSPENLITTIECGSYSAVTDKWATATQDAVVGSVGKAEAVSALKLNLADNKVGGSISYSVHEGNVGWVDSVADGAQIGTGKTGNEIEALTISLSGEITRYYDIYYRVYATKIGWMGWAMNGQKAGTEGFGRSIEAYQVKLVAKGGMAPGSTANHFKKKVKVDEIIASIDSGSTGNSLKVFGTGRSLSQSTIDRIYSALDNFSSAGKDVGFTLVDLNTGLGISYNSDVIFASACSIKGPYTISMCQGDPTACSRYRDLIYPALEHSDNETYISYFNSEGHWPMDRYINRGHVEKFSWSGWTARYSAEDLARMWVCSAEYLLEDGSDDCEWLKSILSNNSAGMTREAALAHGVGTTYAKSGWTDVTRTEGALVMDGDHPYVTGIMSTANLNYSWMIIELADALYTAHYELTR